MFIELKALDRVHNQSEVRTFHGKSTMGIGQLPLRSPILSLTERSAVRVVK